MGEHGREKLLVGNKLHVLGSNVDAGQVNRRQPVQAATAFLLDPASDRHIMRAYPVCSLPECLYLDQLKQHSNVRKTAPSAQRLCLAVAVRGSDCKGTSHTLVQQVR